MRVRRTAYLCMVLALLASLAPMGSQANMSPSGLYFNDSSQGGAICYNALAGESYQTFCFTAALFSEDGQDVEAIWGQAPPNWVATDVTLSAAPSCYGGQPGAGPFLAYFDDADPGVFSIFHQVMLESYGSCDVTYCVEFRIDAPAGAPTGGNITVPWNIHGWYEEDARGQPIHALPWYVCSAGWSDTDIPCHEVSVDWDAATVPVCPTSGVDSDGDGWADDSDNCPAVYNPEQLDTDVDGVGDVCDGCPYEYNPDQTDADGDWVLDCADNCPLLYNPDQDDSDSDGVGDACDGCAYDPLKVAPGACGCGVPDVDSDGDGTPDCDDQCPLDPDKTAPGACGCGVPDVDSDADGTPDCVDACPLDPNKVEPGSNGCGVPDTLDSDGDGWADDSDNCLYDYNPDQADADQDGTGDACDQCPLDPDKTAPGACGCGVPDVDSDADGTPDCDDECPLDSDADGTPDCETAPADVDSDATARPARVLPRQDGARRLRLRCARRRQRCRRHARLR